MDNVFSLTRSIQHLPIGLPPNDDNSPMESLMFHPVNEPLRQLFSPGGRFSSPTPIPATYFHPDIFVCGMETPRLSDDKAKTLVESHGLKIASSRTPRVPNRPDMSGHPGSLTLNSLEDARTALDLINVQNLCVIERLDSEEKNRLHWWRYLPAAVIILDAFPHQNWTLTYPPTLVTAL